jgi:polyisoprenoid-binding protein YceI
MKPLFTWLGVAAVFGWTALGAAAWFATKENVTVVLSEGEATRAPADDPLALVADDVAALRGDLSALVATLGANLETLDARGQERSDELARELAGLRVELARLGGAREGELLAEVRKLRTDVAGLGTRAIEVASAPSMDTASGEPTVAVDEPIEPAIAPVAEPVTQPTVDVAATEPAPKRSSFLAFTLPSDDFRFDERRAWTVVANLSRVGFDGKSTLHDFTGTTSTLSGTFDFDLAHAADAPHGTIRVDANSLDTGSEGRDEEMDDVLQVAQHGEFLFELTAFEPESVDAAAQSVRGVARGTLTIRGVAREIAMPVTATVDASRRLVLEGEANVHLPDFGVPVPNKLGLVSMEPDVRIWIALRAKLEPRAAGAKS